MIKVDIKYHGRPEEAQPIADFIKKGINYLMPLADGTVRFWVESAPLGVEIGGGAGVCPCEKCRKKAKKDPMSQIIMIALNSVIPFKDRFLHLAHELVHVKQILAGELEHPDESDAVVWHGRHMAAVSGSAGARSQEEYLAKYAQYSSQPWEEEAFGRMEEVFKAAGGEEIAPGARWIAELDPEEAERRAKLELLLKLGELFGRDDGSRESHVTA